MAHTAHNLADGGGGFALAVAVVKLDTALVHLAFPPFRIWGRGTQPSPKTKAAPFFAGGLFVCGYFRLVDAFDLINIRPDFGAYS